MLTLEDVSDHADRPPASLTRRDVARALLSVPSEQALASLPVIRRGLVAAGNPLSQNAGESGFLWPDEHERGPVAQEMHERLVIHLEGLVVSGEIDPDRLLAEDRAAWEAYERIQHAWLYTPLPDGREPIWAVSDEEDEEFLAQWDAAEAQAREVLADLLAEVGPRLRPEAELRAACERLRPGLRAGDWPYDLLRAAGGVDPAALPEDDEELWLTLAAGVVSCVDEPPEGVLDDEIAAAWMTLGHDDWVAVSASLAELGPGAPADAESLATYVVEFEFDEDDEDEEAFGQPDDTAFFDDLGEFDDDGFLSLSVGFGTVERLWRALGAIDRDDDLTTLGWWGLPEATLRAWQPRE